MGAPRFDGPGWIPGSNLRLRILYGLAGWRGKEERGRGEGPGRFTYPGDRGPGKPGAARAHRVSSGRGVDASGVMGGDSKGDTRTYPEGSPGLSRAPGGVPPTTKAAAPCASTFP
ncbi:hypothetical protein CJD44_34650 [Streptomyces sp. alain-838]|nr:hypothetical protein CJD44_34650 [Streptomyces sp. alain-838]